MPWIEEEEALLKEKLTGLVVTDGRKPGGRPVRTWFRWPEMEQRDIQRDPAATMEAQYPFITIDLINVGEALDRAQRGGQMRPTVEGYRPPGTLPSATPGRIHVTEWPVAMNLDYQITTHARNIQHDRQMMRQLWALFPGRYGSLGGNAAPYVRPFSAQLLNMTPGDRIDEFGKRQFRKIFSLRIFSELWASPIVERTEVTDIEINLPIDIPPGEWFSDINCYESE